MSCCPSQSHGFLDGSAYEQKGKVENCDGLDIYIVGEGENCVIWNYDIFGFNGGRTRQHCDLLASHGYMVVLPDYYKGTFIEPQDPGLMDFIKSYPFSAMQGDVDNVISFAKGRGAKAFGSVGTCWGSYLVLKLSSYPDFKAGVSIHPSHSKMLGLLEESEEELLSAVKCKQLIMAAGNDHENCQPGGLAQKMLKENVVIEAFPDMVHGWSTRGDLSEPNIKRDVDRAVALYLQFFKDNL